ncbi:hypothetical protein LNV08_17910 [Paucibacter sp. TC2R-5]|uniref:hypothetical protein n=1 Tax=Paucibacter sp. TC2R-5 TaxID=2893555 RepID=UPI0021E3AA75|nr:hypothetical protein [Paucibacter sp. TC2R-5]MCV2360853.1 hypothetical protein [Paucibacter sp. TC2R-5]
MQTIRPLFKSSVLACALALASAPAWSAVADSSKAKSRPAAKATPAPKAPIAEPVDNTPLNEEQIAVAPQVHAGDANCEFKNKVTVTPDPENPGRFRLQFGKLVYNMVPEPTTTGAVRLEDKKAGVVWLQIPTKSMLMNTKVGQRMVDYCMHSAQVSEAQSAALSSAQEESSPKPSGGSSALSGGAADKR